MGGLSWVPSRVWEFVLSADGTVMLHCWWMEKRAAKTRLQHHFLNSSNKHYCYSLNLCCFPIFEATPSCLGEREHNSSSEYHYVSFCTLSFFIPNSREGRLKGKTCQEGEKEESAERRKPAEQAHQERRPVWESDHIVLLRGQGCLKSPGKNPYQSNHTKSSCIQFAFWSPDGD